MAASWRKCVQKPGCISVLSLVHVQTNLFYMGGSTEIMLKKVLRQHKTKIAGDIFL